MSVEAKRKKDENGTSTSALDESKAAIRPASTAPHSAKPSPLSPDSFKNSKSSSPSCDSPLSAEKEKSKRSKSSSKEKAESVKPERTSSAAKKVSFWVWSEFDSDTSPLSTSLIFRVHKHQNLNLSSVSTFLSPERSFVLCRRSPDMTRTNRKRKRRGTAAEEKKRKNNILEHVP